MIVEVHDAVMSLTSCIHVYAIYAATHKDKGQTEEKLRRPAIQCCKLCMSYSLVKYADLLHSIVHFADLSYGVVKYADLLHSIVNFANLLYSTVYYADLLYCVVEYAYLLHSGVNFADLLHSVL